MQYIKQHKNDVTFYEVDHHRYVVHFLTIADNYTTAINKARKLGGKVYRAKWFGGGIVFDTNDSADTFTRNIRALQANMI